MIQHQKFSDTTIHKVGDKPLLHGTVSGNALSPLPYELINRMYSIIKNPNHSPYHKDKQSERVELFVKIKELKKIEKQCHRIG